MSEVSEDWLHFHSSGCSKGKLQSKFYYMNRHLFKNKKNQNQKIKTLKPTLCIGRLSSVYFVSSVKSELCCFRRSSGIHWSWHEVNPESGFYYPESQHQITRNVPRERTAKALSITPTDIPTGFAYHHSFFFFSLKSHFVVNDLQ
jgi:hypothetical protein